MRRLWRWLTGRTLKDAVPQYDLDWWNRAVEFENIDLGAHVITVDRPLHDDFSYEVTARRTALADLTDALHDSTMMARIDKGKQRVTWIPTAGVFPFVPLLVAEPEPDPYVWHDVADMIQQARHV